MNPAPVERLLVRRSCRLWACACIGAVVAACAHGPAPAPARPAAPAPPAAPDAERGSVPPKLRSIRPAEPAREEPVVGVGGLTHEAAQPAQ